MTGELLDGNIGYIKIDNFDERSAAETIAFVKDLIGQGAEALLFDVRFNPGGYADELVKVLTICCRRAICSAAWITRGARRSTPRTQAVSSCRWQCS